MDNTDFFTVDVVGEDSGTRWFGKFVVKTLLSRKDRFMADEKRRLVLGADAINASVDRATEAFMFGQLSVRVVESPTWWKESNGGLNLPDLNVIATVFNEAMQCEDKRKKALSEQAESAAKEVKEAVSKME
jgi:hypothetical protein